MTHAYPRKLFVGSILLQDFLLALVFVGILASHPSGLFPRALAGAILVALGWGVLTLHFPSRIEVAEDHVTFHRYGRAHRFAWKDVQAVRVRRFLVRDRVLVRVVPSPPWRGRYWILESIEGFDALVRGLEARG